MTYIEGRRERARCAYERKRRREQVWCGFILALLVVVGMGAR